MQKWPVSRGLFGSMLTLFICFIIAFPLGVATAVYLEVFAPKNKFTEIIEVNINNLAAVPSVVFGILGWQFLSICLVCRARYLWWRDRAGADDIANHYHLLARLATRRAAQHP